MTDVVLQPASAYDGTKAAKLVPAFLVSLLPVGKGPNGYFIATKYEETVGCAKCIGFFYGENIDELNTKAMSVIAGTNANKFVEMSFPWGRIIDIKSLVYRHKETK